MFNPFSNIFILTLSFVSLTGCSGNKAKSIDISAIEKNDSIPAAVKELVKAVAENDTARFASLVSYPLARPYPLHDLENAEQLESYYPQIMDDSLKHRITDADASLWEEYGWRGWSLDKGEYIWIDENVYDVPYLSSAEKHMLDSLVNREISSLHPSLQEGWLPKITYASNDGVHLYRIDMSKDDKGHPLYRLCVYEKDGELSGIPSDIMFGYKQCEGTADTEIYYFTGADGTKATLEPDMPDGSGVTIEFEKNGLQVQSIPLTKSYWLDHI